MYSEEFQRDDDNVSCNWLHSLNATLPMSGAVHVLIVVH